MQPTKAFVLGGSGHIGNAMARALLQRGYQVSVSCRQASHRANLACLNVDILTGDDQTPGQMAKWIEGHQLIVDAAAPYPLHLFDPEVSRDQSLKKALARTRALIGAIRSQNAKLIYLSSFTTLRKKASLLSQLQSGLLQGSHPYFEIKRLIEREIIHEAGRGLKAAIINPSVCLGPWDLKPSEACFVAAVARGDLLGVSGQKLNIIDVRDVADASLKAFEAERYGEPIALSGHNIELDRLVQQICNLAGCKPPVMRGSTRLAAMGAYCLDAMYNSVGQPSPYPSLPFLLLCECHATEPSAAQRKLDLKPRHLDTTLSEALDWYREIGYC